MANIGGAALDTFKDLVWDSLVELALADLFEIKLLGWGPIKALITWIVLKYSALLYERLRKVIVTAVIAMQNAQFQNQYAKSAIALKAVANSAGIESETFRQARDENKEILKPSIRYALVRAS